MVSPAPSSDDVLPRRFGAYQLFDKIGEGGMARIYLGRAKTELGGERLVVVKQILPELSESESFSQLLVDEAKLAARLSHGNVAQVIDLGRAEDTLYIAMEYVEGFDLRDLLKHCSKSKVPLPTEFSLLAVMETLRALDYAHRKKGDDRQPLGIVHRDVSPSNVLVSFEGEVKLCDFGIARAIGSARELSEEAIQGKAGYMSPEAARGDALDARSDVFAVGIIAWELLAGRRLYSAKAGSVLEQARAAVIPDLPPRGYAEEDRLFSIVGKALAVDRGDRYESARAMLRDLETYVSDTGMVASPLRLGEWLVDHFGAAIIETRRARERAAKAVEAGPLVELQPTSTPPPAVDGSDVDDETSGTRAKGERESEEANSGLDRSSDGADVPSRPDAGGGFPVWVVVAIVAVAALVAALFLLQS